MQQGLFRDLPTRRTPYTPDTRDAILRDIAEASAADVALRHGVSRCVVLGLVYRARQAGEHVTTRIRPTTPPGVHAPRPVPVPTVRRHVTRTPAPAVRAEPALPPVAITCGEAVTLMTAGLRRSRAIVGPAADGDVPMCGRPTAGGAWCPVHAAVYQPSRRSR